MNKAQIAVIHVSLDEWNEQRALLKEVSEHVKALNSKEQKELLTTPEVCEMLKIGRTTFERYVNDGIIDCVRVNKRKYSKKYVRRSHLEELIKNGRV